MSFNIFDGLDFLADLLSLEFSSKSESVNSKKNKNSKKSKYTTALWSGGFLLIASILYFIVFKDLYRKRITCKLY